MKHEHVVVRGGVGGDVGWVFRKWCIHLEKSCNAPANVR